MTVLDPIVLAASERPDHPAVVFDDPSAETVTYRDLVDRVEVAAGALMGAGAESGDRVAYLGPNAPAFLIAFLACARIGAVFVPLNTRLAPAEHGVQLANCRPTLAIGDGSAVDQLREALAIGDGSAVGSSSVVAVDRLAEAGPTSGRPSHTPGPDDPVLLVYTSGTTGSPKGAVHTHRSLRHTVENGVAAQDLTGEDVALIFLPLFHVGGLNIQVMPLLSVGGTVVLQPGFDPGAVLAAIETHRPTVSLFVPATIRATIGHPEFTSADLSSLRGVMTGSSIVPDDLLRGFRSAGLEPGQVYGSTETGPTAVVLRFDEAHHVGLAGRPARHTGVRIAEDGELQVRGPHLFSHYWDNPGATEAAFDGDWYRTGDLARYEGELIRIVGRIDEVIISGGENINPEEVESVLVEAPGVADVAVLARPDDRWGEVPVAVVVPDGDPPTIDVLRSHGRDRLAGYKLPVDLVVVDAIPRTALGKIQRFALRSQTETDL